MFWRFFSISSSISVSFLTQGFKFIIVLHAILAGIWWYCFLLFLFFLLYVEKSQNVYLTEKPKFRIIHLWVKREECTENNRNYGRFGILMRHTLYTSYSFLTPFTIHLHSVRHSSLVSHIKWWNARNLLLTKCNTSYQ